MTFNSLEFLAFLSVTLLCYRLAPMGLRFWVLLIGNAYFLSSFAETPMDLAPFAGFLLVGFTLVRIARPGLSKMTVGVLAGSLIFAFIYLKKYSFISFLPFIHVPYLEIGMSYIFFRMLHLLLDRCMGEATETISLPAFFNYTCFFPSLLSGPIQFWQDHVKQMVPTPLTERQASDALSRLLTGYIKVFALAELMYSLHADNVALVDNPVLAGGRIVFGAALFFLYMYFNFSGYMDIVIGVAGLFGYTLPENFNRPFVARSIINFWNRWHITLSYWFQIYMFTPMLKAMMHRWSSPKAIPYLGCITYFATFLLLGIWHGRTWMFVILGLMLATGVSLNKLYQIQMIKGMSKKKYNALTSNNLYQAVCRGLTFSYISCCLSCMWLTPEILDRIFTIQFFPVVVVAWIAQGLVAAAVIQIWRSGYGILESLLQHFQDVDNFYARNAWVIFKLFLYSQIAIQTLQPQRFVYQGF